MQFSILNLMMLTALIAATCAFLIYPHIMLIPSIMGTTIPLMGIIITEGGINYRELTYIVFGFSTLGYVMGIWLVAI